MEKKSRSVRRRSPALSIESRVVGFPETCSTVLHAAAAGDWQEFLKNYLRPIGRELSIFGRKYGLDLADQDDICQELIVQIMRESPLPTSGTSDRANFVGRYLSGRPGFMRSASFRTFLKATIRNQVMEALRRRMRRRTTPLPAEDAIPALMDSVATLLDLQDVTQAFQSAAEALRDECATARTKARRLLFDILYESMVERRTPLELTQRHGVDRTTVIGWRQAAGDRFMWHLQQQTRIEDRSFLKRAAKEMPQKLVDAVALARQSNGCRVLRDEGDGLVAIRVIGALPTAASGDSNSRLIGGEIKARKPRGG